MLEETIDADFNPWIIQVGGLNDRTCPPPGFVMERRRVRWYELECIHEGSGHILTDGARIPTSAGSVFFRWPGMIVQGVAPYLCDLVVFDSRWSAQRSAWYSECPLLDCDEEDPRRGAAPTPLAHRPVFRPKDPPAVRAGFALIRERFDQARAGRVLELRMALLGIILALRATPIEGEGPRRGRISAVLDYIDANPALEFTLAELAAIACLSPHSFCRAFGKAVGMTPFEYVHKSKIAAARGLLSRTDYPVKEIAQRVGIPNESYFYTLFKRLEGMSPREYRRKQGYPL